MQLRISKTSLMISAGLACASLIPAYAAEERIKAYPVAELRARFDVAGVKIGTPMHEAISILQTKGFAYNGRRVDYHHSGPCKRKPMVDPTSPWGHETTTIIPYVPGKDRCLNGSYLKTANLQNSRREVVELIAEMMPSGTVVTEIRYTIPKAIMREDEFIKQTTAKYGPSRRPRAPHYCFEREPDCRGSNVFPAIYSLNAALEYHSTEPVWFFTVYEGKYLKTLRNKQITAYNEALNPHKEVDASF